MVARIAILVALAAAPTGVPAQTGDPMSAIGWLSDSVTAPAVRPEPEKSESVAGPPASVTVATLEQTLPDHAGWRLPDDLGLQADIWGRSSARDLAQLLSAIDLRDSSPSALRDFVRHLVTTRLPPPVDAVADDSLYLARVDMLLQMGFLDDAERLLTQAGHNNPERFRRAFDIALLKEQESEACAAISTTPEISPTVPARIFCLARNGEWDVAALTLGTAEALDLLSDDEEKLLLQFLDPELFEGEPLPQAPLRPSPLTFRLYEAVGERLPTEQMPVAFAIADTTDAVGWRTRLLAAERLAAAGALSLDGFLSVVLERKPSASGGVFDRVADIQAAAEAPTADTLSAAWTSAGVGGYRTLLAPWLTDRLDPDDPFRDGFEIALFAGNVALAQAFSQGTEAERFILATAARASGAPLPPDEFSRAVRRGLAASGPGQRYVQLIEDDRTGEALLRAMDTLASTVSGSNPNAVSDALGLLVSIGLVELAHDIAVQLLLAEGQA